MFKANFSGFTLVELSIVLVIISLVIGGVIVGQDMIKSARLKSVISDAQKYHAAVNTFTEAYGALPGDLSNASSYWPSDCVDTGANHCDGNGNGSIAWLEDPRDFYETYRAWQHLALAKIIPGSYDAAPTAGVLATEQQLPLSAIAGAFFSFNYAYSSHPCFEDRKNCIVFGTGDTRTTPPSAALPALKPADAFSIDKKIDDGIAFTGAVRSFNAYSTGTLSGCELIDESGFAVGGFGDYDLDGIGVDCALSFIMD